MTDLKPEDLVKLREIAEKAQAACPNWHHIGMSDPFAIYVNAFRPELVLSLLADRARMEKALREIAFLRPGGPTRNKMVEQMERIAIDALQTGASQ